MPMTRTDVVSSVAQRAGLTTAQGDAALTALQDVLVEALRAGEAVRIQGLLTVERAERAARTGRNPRTGEALEIPAGHVVRVSAGSVLKAAVKS
ncbi:integration host factor [Actinotalea ferrariae CF5-4]|uniref:Integration host factor n=1 Tax=Actinotalea ferrariae CF5-4 TaxID=948458 RepID=A0A021VUX1_9CELL|nr:HU family DNA-binding protein [Actinotalea ferrariae]EYR62852.1 integration host factor [Actinotalea ferrariae CF5-4]